ADVKHELAWHPGQAAHFAAPLGQCELESARDVGAAQQRALFDRQTIVVHKAPVLRRRCGLTVIEADHHIETRCDGDAQVGPDAGAVEVLAIACELVGDEVIPVTARTTGQPSDPKTERAGRPAEQEVGRGSRRGGRVLFTGVAGTEYGEHEDHGEPQAHQLYLSRAGRRRPASAKSSARAGTRVGRSVLKANVTPVPNPCKR